MKLLIFSDSHGDERKMDTAIRNHRDADVLIHLGDGSREFNILCGEHPEKQHICVCGNGEDPLGRDPLPALVTEIGGHRILITHGHRYSVKSSMDRLMEEAFRRNADIVLFGHTHVPLEKYITCGPYPLWLFNPGSISRPIEGKGSYGILDIRKNGVLFSHAYI